MYLDFFVQNNGGFDENVKHRLNDSELSGEKRCVFYAIKEFQ